MLVMRGTVPFMMGCLNEGDDEMSTTTLPRFATDTNHKPVPARTSKAPVKPKTPPKPKPSDHLVGWSRFGVILMAGLSAYLNGYANSLHATIPLAGWLVGIVIPLIVFLLGKVGGKQYRRKHYIRSRITGGAGVFLLILSIYHCAQSLSLLTGYPVWSTCLMAITVDVGFVACEIAEL
jgi:hypothetical protein